MDLPKRAPRNRIVIAHHMVFMGYGHWLPNDIRGSGSDEIRKELLRELGEIHHGRKPIQPSRAQLKAFHRQAEPLLERDVIWFDESARLAIGHGFERAAREQGYVVWACAVLRNHAHLVVARHRQPYQVMWPTLAEFARTELLDRSLAPDQHPVWGNRPYSRFLYTPDDIRRRVGYVEENPAKEGLPAQDWGFVRALKR